MSNPSAHNSKDAQTPPTHNSDPKRYEYIGPDAIAVNAAIEKDRQNDREGKILAELRSSNEPAAEQVAAFVRNSTKALRERTTDRVNDSFSAREIAKAIGIIEAREHEGRY